jgi:hypothetical protein
MANATFESLLGSYNYSEYELKFDNQGEIDSFNNLVIASKELELVWNSYLADLEDAQVAQDVKDMIEGEQ